MPLPHAEPNELLLEMDAANMLIRWRAFIKERIETSFAHDGKRCIIILEPYTVIPIVGDLPATIPPGCPADVLDVLRSAHPMRLTQPMICENLEVKGVEHSSRNVSFAIDTLDELGLITRPRPGSRDGYGIKAG